MALLIGLGIVPAANSAETAFGYTTAGISGGNFHYDKPLDIGGVIYDDLGVGTLAGYYQFADNFYAGLSFDLKKGSGTGTDITDRTSSLELGAVVPVASTVDLAMSFASLGSKTETCIDSACSTGNEDGFRLSFGAQAWALPSIAIGANYRKYDYGQGMSGHSYTVKVSPYFGINMNHSIGIAYTVDDDINTRLEIGYMYTFNPPQLR
jgi:hypothetical protein